MTGPVPAIPPGAVTSAVTFFMGDVSKDLSTTGLMVMLRIRGKVQPVSSYGAGFAGEKFWREKYMSARVRYGWSPRTM